ncbi:MAG: hypothetical protein QM581_10935 [Pseudomonas sp.]
MSHVSKRTDVRDRTRGERLQAWVAALVSALVHVLMLLLLLLASTLPIAPPQGSSGGSRMRVDLLGETRQDVQTPPLRAVPPTPAKPKPVHRRRASSPVRATLVEHADNPLPPDDDGPPDLQTATQSSAPKASPAQTRSQAQAAPASPPPSAQRRPETWTGRPPGMLDEDLADQDAGTASGDDPDHGRGHDPNGNGPSMEVGGYMVYYDLRSETQLRAWKAQGMKELFLPLPGTRSYMVCPLQVALERGSGKCRLLAPDSPELKAIGDAREGINMMQVYHRGDAVWKGPGPYR